LYIIRDFFLLNWQENFKGDFYEDKNLQKTFQTMFQTEYENLNDYISIILTCNEKNSEKFLALPFFKEILFSFLPQNKFEKNTLQMLQKNILFFLEKKGDLTLNKSIQKKIDFLRKEDILGYEKARELMSILMLIPQKVEKQDEKVFFDEIENNFYQNNINALERIIQRLKQLIEVSSQKNQLSDLLKKAKAQTFSIGVTGVMNAGKSTLLNALLRKDLLGTSVVPETANLTILKYAKEPRALVSFWKESEWQKIKDNASYNENLAKFVSQTEDFFQKDFKNYITKDGNSFEIDVKDLIYYTSAKHSEKKCNLIKSVELYDTLKFLQDGVIIVDTPGLDDPVVQREEITKEYLNRCDFMMHLMNVNQSATKKDVDFLCDTLLYQNVSRLLVLITRIDTVNEEELQEVIEYTKSAIKQKLIELNKDASFDTIIEKIDFIPVAAKPALVYRTKKQEQKETLDLESTGILKVEAYLDDVLFGKNSDKAKILLLSSSKELLSSIDTSKKAFTSEAQLLNKNTDQIKEQLQEHQQEVQRIQSYLQKLDEKVQASKGELENYFFTLKNLLQNKIIRLQNLIKRRIIDDVSYEKRKNKQKPKRQRIATIIQTGINDGIIDVLREYRYNFEKKVGEVYETLNKEFENLLYEGYKVQDSKEFFQKYFEINFLTKSVSFLSENTNHSIDKLFKQDIELLDEELQEYFGLFFKELYESFLEKIQNINKTLLEDFQSGMSQKVQAINEAMQTDENILLSALENLQNSTFNKEVRLEELEQKITALDDMRDELITLRKDFE
jgi:GTPase Era involved in 16S rRNA processing